MIEARRRLRALERRYGCRTTLSVEWGRFDPLQYSDRRFYRVTLTGGKLAYRNGISKDLLSEDMDDVVDFAEDWAEQAHAKWAQAQGTMP